MTHGLGGKSYQLKSGHIVTVPSCNPTNQGIKKMQAWLLSTIEQEAQNRHDTYVPLLFKSEVAGKMPPMSVELANDYIFDGAVEWIPVK